GKFGARCKNDCGMNVSHYFGDTLSDTCVRGLLAGEKILVKGLISKNSKKYDAYFKPKGIKETQYKKKDGTVVNGFSWDFEMSFPEKKKKKTGHKSKT
ncbi:MAG: DNA topoisomerase III, partial [Butyrivibrio sp.]|nr:DNA topoisomerase III [Butyrivibrio sp.]